jgi:hypothetical protein
MWEIPTQIMMRITFRDLQIPPGRERRRTVPHEKMGAIQGSTYVPRILAVAFSFFTKRRHHR